MATGRGRIPFGSDFTGLYDAVVWGTGTLVAGDGLGAGLGFTSDDEGSFATTVDETGGILDILTDVGDDDSAAITAGKFACRDGYIELETRFKYSSLDCAIFAGFTEVMSLTAPVMPLEFATATMTYVAASNVLGFSYDVDGTTDDFRAAMGDGGAAISDSANGIRANATLTVDHWFEARVIAHEDGSGSCWLGDQGHANSNGINNMRLIKRFTTGTLMSTTDPLFAALMIENRSGNARHLEVDYFFGSGGRDWRHA